MWHEGRQLRAFESQRVRALLAYLALHRRRLFSRDHLAGLLWPERDEEASRRNLRQAIYNLKAALPSGAEVSPYIRADNLEIGFDPQADYWLDVEAFEDALQVGGSAAETHDLVRAAQLYRGDLLAGFFLRDAPAFEEWMVTEQERLRELGLDSLRLLVGAYRARGEYRLGVQYARRLVAMDPLSEEAHRSLMGLYGLAGRRSRALAHYGELRQLLARELGVEPLPETTHLYQAILAEESPREEPRDEVEPFGPIVPLVGRQESYDVLRQSWQSVLGGQGRITLVEGESGIGKTRLVRSFLDATTVQRRAVVLTARCVEQEPQPAFQAVVEALTQALDEEPDGVAALQAALPTATRIELARVLPEITVPAGARGAASPSGGRGPLLAALARLLEHLSLRDGGEGGLASPLILFLDDLHWADASTLDFLRSLAERPLQAPVWIVATWCAQGLPQEHPLSSLARLPEVERISLGRLQADDVEEIARLMVGENQVRELAELLARRAAGLPLAVSTLINALWEEGLLEARRDRRWSFRGIAGRSAATLGEGLDDMILHRLRRLPTSTRRLAALAAVIGTWFDTALLQKAENEHVAVIEIGLEILLERWLIRQHRRHWSTTAPESAAALWAKGERHGGFAFDHERIRSALYRDLNFIRRQAIHRQVAAALEVLHGADAVPPVEAIAHHWLQAGAWDRAWPYLERAAERGLERLSPEIAQRCYALARSALERQAQEARSDEERARCEAEADRLTALADAIEDSATPRGQDSSISSKP